MSKQQYRYWRMQAQGNKFLILDARKEEPRPNPKEVSALAEKMRIEEKPFDQLLLLEPSKHAQVFMRIFNADGGEVEACGNGACAVARLLMDEKGLGSLLPKLKTLSGFHDVRFYKIKMTESGVKELESVAVEVKKPLYGWKEIPLKHEVPDTKEIYLDPPVLAEGKSLPPFCAVNVGNPHAVFFFENRDAMPSLEKVGRVLEHHSIFPRGANISFASVHKTRTSITAWRVWERGVGMTASCGTAACAVVIAAIRTGRMERENLHEVRLRDGSITVHWHGSGLYIGGSPQYDYETKSVNEKKHLVLPEVKNGR